MPSASDATIEAIVYVPVPMSGVAVETTAVPSSRSVMRTGTGDRLAG